MIDYEMIAGRAKKKPRNVRISQIFHCAGHFFTNLALSIVTYLLAASILLAR